MLPGLPAPLSAVQPLSRRQVQDHDQETHASEPQGDKGEMIFELSSLSSDKSKISTEDLVPEKPDICASGRMVRVNIARRARHCLQLVSNRNLTTDDGVGKLPRAIESWGP
jgi:hypothetical protein